LQHGDNPMVRLSHAIAIGMTEGPHAGLAALDAIALDSYRVDAARAHLLERAGELAAAALHYRRAASRTASTPERDYLMLHAARLTEGVDRETPGSAPTLRPPGAGGGAPHS
jgi:predicted RNA polymerase sigma factor